MLCAIQKKVETIEEQIIEVSPFFKGAYLVFYNLDASGYLFRVYIFDNSAEVVCFKPGTSSHAKALSHALTLDDITEDQFLEQLAQVFPNHDSIVPLKKGI